MGLAVNFPASRQELMAHLNQLCIPGPEDRVWDHPAPISSWAPFLLHITSSLGRSHSPPPEVPALLRAAHVPKSELAWASLESTAVLQLIKHNRIYSSQQPVKEALPTSPY